MQHKRSYLILAITGAIAAWLSRPIFASGDPKTDPHNMVAAFQLVRDLPLILVAWGAFFITLGYTVWTAWKRAGGTDGAPCVPLAPPV